jgi:hypothetical protein
MAETIARRWLLGFLEKACADAGGADMAAN